MAEIGGMSSTSAMGEAPKKPENETIDRQEFSKPTTKATITPTIFSSETSLLEEILKEPEEQETTARAESKISCDESERRSDTCAVHGDVRVVGHSSSIILAINSAAAVHGEEEEEEEEGGGIRWKIRPYSRKWETTVMGRIRELTLKESRKPPHCSVNHTVPGIVFSTGGFLGNFFHDFSDVLIPLFTTARRHRGRVQFLVTDFNYGWIAKYETILRRLSYYPIIDLDQERTVHCFLDVHVGLLSHRELGIDPSKAPDGDSMADFREFLRSCFSLSREQAVARSAGRKKPRLLLIDRRGAIWSVFLDKQTVKVDVRRLRGVLEEALQLQGSPPN